ncbi:MAG: polar amino acid transport system substrate-binding protein [Colwellia sp.]|jgi:polar amino acid transport system substrate-binding protein|tara:strand:+ start:2627 stop:3439 length:813 start_codon:yes stop_codon:yes gene_type:complete
MLKKANKGIRLMINLLKIERIFILLFLSFPTLALGQEEITFSTPSFAPFYFSGNNKLCEGVAITTFTQIVAQTNLLFNYVPYPYARVLHSLKTGQLDIALIFKNSALVEHVDYIGPVSKSKVVVLVNSQNSITSYADLSNLKAIAVIRSAHFENKFDNDNSLPKVPVESYAQAIKMFKLGRVDGVVGSVVGLDYQLRMQNVDVNILTNAYVLGEKEWWLHLSKNSSVNNIQSQLNLAVKKSYQEDLIYKIYQQLTYECPMMNKNSKYIKL